jgi:hypothetical protein
MSKPLPRFVNLTDGPVCVFDPSKRTIRIERWDDRSRRTDGVFVVEGDHYRQFVSGNGPLFPASKEAYDPAFTRVFSAVHAPVAAQSRRDSATPPVPPSGTPSLPAGDASVPGAGVAPAGGTPSANASGDVPPAGAKGPVKKNKSPAPKTPPTT